MVVVLELSLVEGLASVCIQHLNAPMCVSSRCSAEAYDANGFAIDVNASETSTQGP